MGCNTHGGPKPVQSTVMFQALHTSTTVVQPPESVSGGQMPVSIEKNHSVPIHESVLQMQSKKSPHRERWRCVSIDTHRRSGSVVVCLQS
jgi:hypothetical protein